MYIVDLWNRLGQAKKFGLPTEMTMNLLGIGSYNTYHKAYTDLVSRGFIKEVQKSTNQYSARIIAMSKIDKATNKALDKATIKASDETTDIIIKQETRNNKQGNLDDFDLTLLEFQKMRKKIKKEMTDHAVELLKKELEKLAPGNKELQIAIMNKSITNCWQGVFALKDDEIKNATDPIVTQYEEQVKICFEKGRADDRENQILTEKRRQLESKYGEEKGGQIRKNIRSKYK